MVVQKKKYFLARTHKTMAQAIEQRPPMKRMNGLSPKSTLLDTIDEGGEDGDTPFLKRTTMKRPMPKTEEELKNDFERALQQDMSGWIQQTFAGTTVLPDTDVSVTCLAKFVRCAYNTIVQQPKFVVTSVRPGNAWTIVAKNEVVRSGKLFAPAESSTMQSRLFAYATYTGARLMLNALFACVCGAYAARGKLYFVDEGGDKLTVMPEMFINFSTDGIWSRNMPKVIVPAQGNKRETAVPVDGNEKTHFTAWMRSRGGKLLEVDLCDIDLVVKTHPVETPVEGMGAMAYLAEARMSAIRTKTVDTMDRTLEALTPMLRVFKKKQKMKARKKKRKNKKKGSKEK